VEEELSSGEFVAREDGGWEFLGIFKGVASGSNCSTLTPGASSIGITGRLGVVGTSAVSGSSLNWFVTKDGLSSSFTNVETESFPVLFVVVSDSGADFSIDFLSVNEEVFTNVINEALWA
jgi:hypothetical protein